MICFAKILKLVQKTRLRQSEFLCSAHLNLLRFLLNVIFKTLVLTKSKAANFLVELYGSENCILRSELFRPGLTPEIQVLGITVCLDIQKLTCIYSCFNLTYLLILSQFGQQHYCNKHQ